MKILVTGNLGYLGSCLVPQLLSLGHKVIGYDNCSGRTPESAITYCTSPNFEFIKGDISHEEDMRKAVEKCDLVVHLAAAVGEPWCRKYENFAYVVNEGGTHNVAKWVKMYNKKIIFSSTGSVYGAIDGVCTENSMCNPVSTYGISKLNAEKEIADTDNYIILRFATAYGLAPSLRLDLLVNDFCYRACRERALVMAQPEFRRTFCHCRDLMNAVIHSIDNFDVMKNEVYNVGNKNGNITKRQLAELIKQKTGCLVFYDEGGKTYKDGDLRDYDTSFEKIEKTGWKPVVELEEGIDELLKAMPFVQINSQYKQRI